MNEFFLQISSHSNLEYHLYIIYKNSTKKNRVTGRVDSAQYLSMDIINRKTL